MPELTPISPLDFDPWHVATPFQLLQLIKRLGVEGTVIANWLGVKPAAISQWSRGKRTIPARYAPVLLMWAQTAWDQAVQRNQKEVASQPTEELQLATGAELATIWGKWKAEVLYEAGTLQKGLRHQYEALGAWLLKGELTESDRETIEMVLENIRVKVDLLIYLQHSKSADLLQEIKKNQSLSSREEQSK
jgi:hypothetical protein